MNVLDRDIKYGKLLLNRDIAHLVTDATGSSKHLGRVVGDENLLGDQANAVVNTLLADSNLLVQDFGGAATALSDAHSIDATLGNQIGLIYDTIGLSVYHDPRHNQSHRNHRRTEFYHGRGSFQRRLN